MTTLDESALYTRSPGHRAVDMDGETVMMGLEQGEYYALRDTAASLWTHLEVPSDVDVLCERIAAEYEVDEAACRADVVAFLTDLLGRGLIRPA